jgi:DNA invertase Pin-like site-specific DNA recombinase
MRVAIYSRYSSDLQDPRSISDQINAAREHAQRQGWTIVSEHKDAAISGATIHNRPGLAELMLRATKKEFDAVLTESLDRLSRDQEDLANIYKRLQFADIKIVTLADGDVGKMHVGIKGMLASMFLDDLAQKTKRGQVGRVKAGRIPGGRCYGYDVVPSIDERGQRAINEKEAAIVQRIFAEYTKGNSPLKIVAKLNREHVPSPRGGAWNASTINGNRKRANGILNNQLYTGKIVFNRQRFVKDPATGKRQARENPRDQWIEHDVPELRIISDDVFEAAQALRFRHSAQQLSRRNRPKHLFSGLVSCGCCGASMIVIRNDYLGCSASRNRATCDNRRTVRVSEIQERILKVLQIYLMAPDVVAIAIEAYRNERERLAKESVRQNRDAARELAIVEKKIQAVIGMAEAGGDVKALAPRLNELEAERRELERRLPKTANVVSLHPRAAEMYADTVRQIHVALGSGENANREAIELVRELVERIDVTPSKDRAKPMQLELVGNLAALLGKPSENPTAMPVVAGAGSNLHLLPEQVKMVAGTSVDHNLRSTPVKMVAGACTHHNLLFRTAA